MADDKAHPVAAHGVHNVVAAHGDHNEVAQHWTIVKEGFGWVPTAFLELPTLGTQPLWQL